MLAVVNKACMFVVLANFWLLLLGSRAPQGRRLGDERLEVLVLLVAPGELPRVGRN